MLINLALASLFTWSEVIFLWELWRDFLGTLFVDLTESIVELSFYVADFWPWVRPSGGFCKLKVCPNRISCCVKLWFFYWSSRFSLEILWIWTATSWWLTTALCGAFRIFPVGKEPPCTRFEHLFVFGLWILSAGLWPLVYPLRVSTRSSSFPGFEFAEASFCCHFESRWNRIWFESGVT